MACFEGGAREDRTADTSASKQEDMMFCDRIQHFVRTALFSASEIYLFIVN